MYTGWNFDEYFVAFGMLGREKYKKLATARFNLAVGSLQYGDSGTAASKIGMETPKFLTEK